MPLFFFPSLPVLGPASLTPYSIARPPDTGMGVEAAPPCSSSPSFLRVLTPYFCSHASDCLSKCIYLMKPKWALRCATILVQLNLWFAIFILVQMMSVALMRSLYLLSRGLWKCSSVLRALEEREILEQGSGLVWRLSSELWKAKGILPTDEMNGVNREISSPINWYTPIEWPRGECW